MKKSLVALAALSLVGGAAMAQSAAPTSSVTLFGVMDVNARFTDNGTDSRYDLGTDGIASSRLGVRGEEALGGGLRAGFWLEAGLSPDAGLAGGNVNLTPATGQSALFNRRATVSLLGNWGELRLGRDYIPTFWNLTAFDPFGTNGVGGYNNVHIFGAPPNFQDIVRANNSIGYFLPAGIGGLYGQAMIAAGEGFPPNTPANKYYGGRIGWAAGPFNVAASYGTREVNPVSGDDSIQNWNLAGSWALGPFNLMAQYGTFELANVDLVNWLVGATWKLGPGLLKFSYSAFDGDDPGNIGGLGTSPDATQIAIGYQYDVSRRTALYANAAFTDNNNGARFRQASGVAGLANESYTGFEVGIRHSF